MVRHQLCIINIVIFNKAPLLYSQISDNDLSILAITKKWVKSDDPLVIMNDPAPLDYSILHVQWDNLDQSRGDGLSPLSNRLLRLLEFLVTVTVKPGLVRVSRGHFVEGLF